MNMTRRSKRWAEGIAAPRRTAALIRSLLSNGHSRAHIEWLFWSGLAHVMLGTKLRRCNSCCQLGIEAPTEDCRCRGFHQLNSNVRYSRLKTGPRKYLLDAEGKPPVGIYESAKERKARFAAALVKMNGDLQQGHGE